MNISSGGFTSSFILRDFARGIVMLPVWWYTIGLATVVSGSVRNVKSVVRNFGLDVWAKNLFVPMYGETTFSGKLISFLMRFVVVIFQSLGVVIWSVILFALFIVYLIALPFSILGILSYGFGMLFF